jgi:hypothetical protein
MDADDDGVVLMSTAGPESTILDGLDQNGPPLIRIQDVGPPTAVIGFTLRQNRVISTGGNYGAGVRCDNAGVRLEGNVIAENWARYSGGGVCAFECAGLVVVGNTIRGNTSGEGGGIYLEYCQATILDNDIEDNLADGWFSDWGGGIAANGGVIDVVGNRIRRNVTVGVGGALYLDRGVGGTISDNQIDSNTGGRGGAFYICDASASLTIERNTIVANETGGPWPSIIHFWCTDFHSLCSGNVIVRDNIIAGNVGTVVGVRSGALPSLTQNSIDGNAHLIINVHADVQPGTLDMTGTWWGTADPDSIASLIWDCNDDPGIQACVDFSDWCTDPSCAGQVTSVPEAGEPEPATWSRIKSIYR